MAGLKASLESLKAVEFAKAGCCWVHDQFHGQVATDAADAEHCKKKTSTTWSGVAFSSWFGTFSSPVPFQLTLKLQSSTLESHRKGHTLFQVPRQFVRSEFVLWTARIFKSAQNVALVKP